MTMTKEITSLQHPLVKHLAHLRQNRDYRYEHRSVVLDGIKPVTEIAASHKIKTILACSPTMIPKGIKAKDVVICSEAIMHKISGMVSPEGLIAEFEMPKEATLKGTKYVIAFDNINDPGNLGTLLRTALAFGWEGAFILGETCDPYNDKALRASRGATFRLPIRHGTWEELQKLAKDNKMKAVVADTNGEDLDTYKAKGSCLLVMCNEAHGPSPEIAQFCEKIHIPMPGEMESLNVAVAGGILMYSLKR